MAAVAFAGPAAANVLWRGDFETGDRSQWNKEEMIAPDRLQVVEAPMRPGRLALRAEVRKGDDPINASGNRNELVKHDGATEGRELYYGWSTLWPADYPLTPTWQVFMQWHHPGNNGAPPVRFVVGCSAGDCGRPLPDTLFFLVAGKTMWEMAPVTRGEWHDFVLHIKWSADPSVGFVELWYDGQLVVPKTSVRTMYSSGDTNYLKMGLYRDEATDPTQVLFQDGVVQATTYEEAVTDARPDPTPGPPDEGPPSAPAPDPTPAPGNGSGTGGPSPASEVLPQEQAGGCNVGATSALSVPAVLAALTVLVRRRRSTRPPRR